MCRLSWSISNHFVVIYCLNARCKKICERNPLKPLFRRIQGCLRTSMLTNLTSNLSKAYVTCDSVQHLSACNKIILIFIRNSLLKCVSQPEIEKNSTKPLFWGFKVVQGHRCRQISLVLVIICSTPVPICNRFHTIRANSGKITTFKGLSLFDAQVREEPLHPETQNFCH